MKIFLKILSITFIINTAIAENQQQLRRGAQIYMDYCVACHALSYLRYGQVAKDIKITSFDKYPLKQIILPSLPNKDAIAWFGIIPPDLSLKAREKGTVWLQNYLSGFYEDRKRPFGVNNYLIPESIMPNVFANISPADYDKTLNDLIVFLEYSAEPARLKRYYLGIKTLAWLSILIFLAIFLKKSYWKNIP